MDKPTLPKWFWNKVDKNAPGGCWNYTGLRDANGYGRILETGKHRRRTKAHRIVWESMFGRLGDRTKHVCHRCDNPSCVNPAHLFVGTSRDNQLDLVAKGKHHLASATHCKHGHEFTPENTGFDQRNGRIKRYCITCHKARGRQSWERKKAKREMEREA